MDDIGRRNLLVLTVFVGCVIAAVAGYLLAWQAKRITYRRAGSLITAAVSGFAGLYMLAWLMPVITDLRHGFRWDPLVPLIVISPLPLGAFYISALFVRRALRDQHK